LLVTKYGNRRVTEEFFDEITDPPRIGDLTRAFVKRETISSGVTEIFYILTFSYRNITHSIGVFGYENETKIEDAVYLAKNILAQLEQIPLSDEVTRKP
jgi:hypothetical protein